MEDKVKALIEDYPDVKISTSKGRDWSVHSMNHEILARCPTLEEAVTVFRDQVTQSSLFRKIQTAYDTAANEPDFRALVKGLLEGP